MTDRQSRSWLASLAWPGAPLAILSAVLFGEAQGRVVATVRTEKQFTVLQKRGELHNIRVSWIGTVGGDNLRIALGAQDIIDLPVSQLSAVSQDAIPRRMKSKA